MEKSTALPGVPGTRRRGSAVDISTIGAIVFLAILPFMIRYPPARDIMIFGLYALSYAIIQGHMGQLSFGHAMFFGLGAYLPALLLHWIPLPPLARWLWVIIGIGGTTLIAYGIAHIVILKRGAYFALTNLAFLQMFYFICIKWRGLTNGEDGFSNIPLPQIGPVELNQLTPSGIYFFSFSIVVICILIIKRIFNDSSFGMVLHAIRENEDRVQFSGFSPYRQMVKAYTLSGLFAGIAGSLYLFNLDFAGPTLFHWILAGDAIIMLMLGGSNVFIGPILGAGIFYGVKDMVGSVFSEHWPVIVGIIVVIFILVLREGLLGQIKALRF